MARPAALPPDWASDGNYVAPGEAWDGDPRRVSVGLAAFAAAGLVPELPVNAEQLNEWLAQIREWLRYAADEIGLALFGNGTDGATTIAGTTTLSDDLHATTLVVQSGGVLRTNGFRVFATESITVDAGGIIECDGSPGGNAAGAGGAPGAARAAGTLGAISIGAAGGGPGLDGINGANMTTALGGTGGAGGDATGTELGGAAGTVTRPTAAQGRYGTTNLPQLVGHLLQAFQGRALDGAQFVGGSPGGSGAADGGGSGSAGGVMLLASPLITNEGTIRALGGDGGDGNGAGSGGGGGGGGAILRLIRQALAGAGVWSVDGGVGGAASGGTSLPGLDGNPGLVGSWVV
jgi:hypothetical protein